MFLAENRLLLLVAVAALAGLYLLTTLTRRRVYAVRFTNLALLGAVAPRRPGWRRHVPAVLLLLTLTSLVIALARPAQAQKLPQERATVILAIDVSNSMAATDVSPSRLTAAQSAAESFLHQVPPKLKVGLVEFDRAATVVVPATVDRDAVRAGVRSLQLGPGTAIGEAVFTSLDAISTAAARDPTAKGDAGPPPARIVLLSDGETTVGRPNEAGGQAALHAGVPVSTIAFGTPDGTLELQGQIIAVPVNQEALRALANQTHGTFSRAESADQLRAVYQGLGSQIGFRTVTREVGRFFVGLALACALVGGLLSLVLWSPRLA